MTSRSKKTLWIILSVVIITTLIVLAVIYFTKPKDPEQPATPNQDPVTTATIDDPESDTSDPTSIEEDPTSSENKTEGIIPDENPKQQTQNEGSDPNQSAVITGAITRADVAGDKLVIRVNIDQYLSGGSCALTLTSNSKTYTEMANLADAASTSTCEGFDIPVSSLASGNWTISINIASGDKQGTITGKATI